MDAENIKLDYEKTTLEKNELLNKINELSQNSSVVEYFKLCKENEILTNKQNELYAKIKKKEFSTCRHILVTTAKENGERFYGCIKCGCDEAMLFRSFGKEGLSLDKQIMYDFMNEDFPNSRHYLHGIQTNICCNIDLATAIYSKIKDKHSDINDETALKYFEIALDNIKSIKVSEEREVSRAKRLSLSSKFLLKTNCYVPLHS